MRVVSASNAPLLRSVPFAVICASLALAGCGGATPAPAAAPVASASAAPVLAPPEPDRSEAPEPEGTFVVARWKSPAASFASIREWAPIPVSLADVLAAIAEDPGASKLLAADASVDAAVALDPAGGESDFRPVAALSFGVTALDGARRELEKRGPVREVRPGFARFTWRRGHLRAACALVAAAGPAPGRIVCGDRERDVDALAPYLARTVTRAAPPASDLHAEVRLSVLERRYGSLLDQSLRLGADLGPSQFQIGQPEFDRALTDAVHGVADEVSTLAKDLGSFAIDVALRPDDATAEATLTFTGKRSWSAQVIADAAPRASAPSPLFWHLPADAAVASYGQGGDPKRFEGIARVLRSLVEGGATHLGLSQADRAALGDLVSTKWIVEGGHASASGSLDAATWAAIAQTGSGKAKARADLTDPEKRALVQVASFGWSLYGVEDAPARSIEAWKKLAAVYGRPAVQEKLRKTAAALEPVLGDALPKIRVSAQAVGLPKGTLEIELSTTTEALVQTSADDFDDQGHRKPKRAKKGGAHPTIRFFVFVMPDGASTWTALGPDRSTLVNHLLAAKSDAAPGGTLAKRAGLDELRAATRSAGGGFMTLAGFARQLRGPLAKDNPDVDLDRVLASAPHHGETPILFTSSVSSDGPVWSAKMRVPRAVVDDVIAIVSTAVMMGK